MQVGKNSYTYPDSPLVSRTRRFKRHHSSSFSSSFDSDTDSDDSAIGYQRVLSEKKHRVSGIDNYCSRYEEDFIQLREEN